jgi:hypothetical protein
VEINDLVKACYERAKKSGWWDVPKSPLEVHALIHSEISEAVEEVRNNMPDVYVVNIDGSPAEIKSTDANSFVMVEGSTIKIMKPEGEAVELVDAIIRICDYFGYKGWDLEQVLKAKMTYNETRSYRHGNKKY